MISQTDVKAQLEEAVKVWGIEIVIDQLVDVCGLNAVKVRRKGYLRSAQYWDEWGRKLTDIEVDTGGE